MRIRFIALATCLVLGAPKIHAAAALLGFSAKDRCYISATASDAAGNVYVCGWTENPAALPKPESRLGPTGAADLFVMKLNPRGETIAAVVLGGSGVEFSVRIAVDAQGDVVLAGQTTSTNFPTRNAFASARSQGFELFVCKLDSTLTNQLFSSYLGTGGSVAGVALDPEGNIRLAGDAWAPGFFSDFVENTAGAFVAQVVADGSALSYVKRVGSAASYVNGFAVNADGDSCVIGRAYGSDLPILNALQPFKSGPEYNGSGFLVRLDKHGELLNSTYLGGPCGEDLAAVGFNAAGEIYVAGTTTSGSIAGAQLSTNECGSSQAFFLKLNSGATQVLHATHLELSGYDRVTSMVVAPDGTALVSGMIGGSYIGLPFLTTVDADGEITTRFPLRDCESLSSVEGMSLESSGTVLLHGQHSRSVYLGGYRVWQVAGAELNRNPQPFVYLAPPLRGGEINELRPPQLSAVPLGFKKPIQSVSFFDGQTLLGKVTRPPYFLQLPALARGAHTFSAVVESAQRDYRSCFVPVTALSPRNDDFAKRIRLTGRQRRIRGNTIAATIETGETSYSGAQTVWYSWTSPFDGVVGLSVQEEARKGFKSGVYGRVFVGRSITGLTAVAETVLGEVAFRVARGSNYQIQISSYGYCKFRMALDAATPPPNDDFTNATAITGPGSFAGTLRDSSADAWEYAYLGKTIWYRWTTPTPGLFLAAVPYGLGYVRVFTGTSLTNLVSIGQNVYGLTNGVAWQAAAEQNYFMAVSSYGAGTNFLLSISAEMPPVNDDFANRLAIPPGGLTATGSCLGATHEMDEPGNFYPAPSTVWWKWVAPSSGVYRTSVSVPYAPYVGSQYGIPGQSGWESVTLYSGTDLAELERAFSLPAFPYYVEQDWHVEQGTEYQIAVSGSASHFTLQLILLQPPPNDDFIAAVSLNGFLPVTGTTAGASVEPGEPTHHPYWGSRSSVWYRWVAPSNGFFTIVSSASVSLYTGETVTALSPVVFTGGRTFRAEEGMTYHLAVFDSAAFNLRVRPAQPPANDDFADAIELAGFDFSFAVNLSEATVEAGEPQFPNSELPRNSIWYSWTAPTSGSFVLHATNSYDALVNVYSGDSLTNLALVSSSSFFFSRVEFQARTGERFFFSVDDSGFGPSFRVELRFHPQPSNDHFTNAIVLIGSSFSFAVTNHGAASEIDEPLHGSYSSRHSVWHAWTAPMSGRVSFKFDADFDSILALYTGQTLTSLVPLLPLDYSERSQFNVPVEAGVTYRLAVDGYSDNSGGGILEIYYTPVPANDAFANRLVVPNGQGSGTVEGASREPLDPSVDEEPLGGSVWWTFTPTTNGVHRISWNPTDYFGLRADIFRGDSLATLERISSPGDYPPVRFIGEAAVPVAIQFLGALGSLAHFDFAITHEPPPANDFFTNRLAFTNTARGTLQGATMESGEPNDVGGAGASVWWSWVAPQSGLYEFRLAEPDYRYSINSLEVHLYTGTNLAELQPLPNRSTRSSAPLFDVAAGTTYAISVDKHTLAGENFRLTPTLRFSPANDHFTNRIALTGSALAVSGGTRYATSEPGEPNWGGASVWYSWTPGFDGTAAIGIVGGYYHFDFFVGDTLESLVRVGGVSYSIGFSTTGALHVSAGTNYKLRITQVYDFPGNTGFTFTITNTAAAALSAQLFNPGQTGRAVLLQIPQSASGVIETSTDLTNWQPFRTNLSERELLIAPRVDEPQRFFRAR